MQFSVLTIHPELVRSFAQVGLISKAVSKGILQIEDINIRDYSEAPHFRVDDKPYGGGPGMLMSCKPVVKAIKEASKENSESKRVCRILLSAKGKAFTQKEAQDLKSFDQIIFVCGRYEGVDQRVTEHYIDREYRVGDYVLMGGELAAFTIIEAVGRLVPGVLGNEASTREESFSEDFEKEYPHYTRPRVFEGHEVPEVLLSGKHEEIRRWRREQNG